MFVPQHDRVEDETERPELVFLAFPIALAELAALTVEDLSGKGARQARQMAGADGAAGAPGRAGTNGFASEAWIARGPAGPFSSPLDAFLPSTLASIELPAGTYTLFAKANIYRDQCSERNMRPEHRRGLGRPGQSRGATRDPHRPTRSPDLERTGDRHIEPSSVSAGRSDLAGCVEPPPTSRPMHGSVRGNASDAVELASQAGGAQVGLLGRARSGPAADEAALRRLVLQMAGTTPRGGIGGSR